MTEERSSESVRVDRWLWAVRIFKTRAQAAQACRLSQVRMEGRPVKPARLLRVDDVLAVEQGPITRTLRVRELLQRRVGAKVAEVYLEEQTTEEEKEKGRAIREQMRGNRVYAGAEGGRPRKRDRRLMEAFEEGEGPSD